MTPRQHRNPILQPQAVDAELERLPPPPTDLPRPWSGPRWRRGFALAFFVTLFALWFLGRQFHLRFMALHTLGGAFATSIAIFLWLGLYLINRYQLRGYFENLSARANRPLNKAIRRYRRPRASEAFYQLFPRYRIDGETYYLIWYVPNVGTAIAASLGPGAEPLLFDARGHWTGDETLFQKAILMWAYGIEFSPKSFTSGLVSDYNGLQKYLVKHLARLPRLLETNAGAFEKRGLKNEWECVVSGFPAKMALFRHALHMMRNLIEWSEAHGWDSIVEMHFDDIEQYHEQMIRVVESQRRFREKFGIPSLEAAAMALRNVVAQRREVFGGWRSRGALDRGLQALSVAVPERTTEFRRVGHNWIGPEQALQAFRSRVAFAREVDARAAAREKGKG
ncbi:MAG: hypothetical protein AB1449_14720 [Chloroflexota bacterium]